MESLAFNLRVDSESDFQSTADKRRMSALLLKPPQFKVSRVPRDVLLSRLGSSDCFIENKNLSKATGNKSQNSDTEKAIIVRRYSSVLNAGAASAGSAVRNELEKPSLPQKSKAISDQLRKPETHSINQRKFTPEPKQQPRQIRSAPIKVKVPKIKETAVEAEPLQKSIFRKLSCADPDIDYEAREKYFNEKIYGSKTKVIRMNATEYKTKMEEARKCFKRTKPRK